MSFIKIGWDDWGCTQISLNKKVITIPKKFWKVCFKNMQKRKKKDNTIMINYTYGLTDCDKRNNTF